MPAKPFYVSRTLISSLVGLVGYFLNVFHVDVSDLLGPLTDALVQYIGDTLTLAGIIGSIVGRIVAAHQLTLSEDAAQDKNNQLVLARSGLSQALTPTAPTGSNASASALPASSTPTHPIDLNDK